MESEERGLCQFQKITYRMDQGNREDLRSDCWKNGAGTDQQVVEHTDC